MSALPKLKKYRSQACSFANGAGELFLTPHVPCDTVSQLCNSDSCLHRLHRGFLPSLYYRNTDYAVRTDACLAFPLPSADDGYKLCCRYGKPDTDIPLRLGVISRSNFCIKQVQFTKICIYMSMTSVSAWIYTVKEIHAAVYCFQNICRSTNAHQVSWFVLPEDVELSTSRI